MTVSSVAANRSGVSRETPASSDADFVSRETVLPAAATAVSRETSVSLLARTALLPLRAYRRFISPALGARCRYYPSCSTYAEEAIRELGAVRGVIVATWRLMRCNPFTKGGFDDVADRSLFRGHGHVHGNRGHA